jgi:hypothetical protein
MHDEPSSTNAGVPPRMDVYLQNSRATKWPMYIAWPPAAAVGAEAYDGLALVSEPLEFDLYVWTSYFHDHHDEGWDAPESALHSSAIGVELARRVAAELGAAFRVLLFVELPGHAEWVEVTAERP